LCHRVFLIVSYLHIKKFHSNRSFNSVEWRVLLAADILRFKKNIFSTFFLAPDKSVSSPH